MTGITQPTSTIQTTSWMNLFRTITSKLVQIFRQLPFALLVFGRVREDRELLSETIDNSSPFEELYEDCFFEIARLLDNTDRRHLTQTCSRFRNLILARSSPDFETRLPMDSVQLSFNSDENSISPMICTRMVFQDRQHSSSADPETRKLALKALVKERPEWPMEDLLKELCRCCLPDNIILAHAEETLSAPRWDAFATLRRVRELALIEHAFAKLDDSQTITLRLRFAFLVEDAEGHQLLRAFLKSSAKQLLVQAPWAFHAQFFEREVRWATAKRREWRLVAVFVEKQIWEYTVTTWILRKGDERKAIGIFFPSDGQIPRDPAKVPVDAIAERFRANVFKNS